ncbi:hypothetical protein [Streptomyces finlayi]|uniref:Uncharacterized protein n=1 Tax=Streptomyces finlayi TaxID=67296 RepID=A0A7G7BGU6_9ACTN|nr:hypothetical protein [Streptomyces finlayi]QNE74561.1 hypothetical protein F0344_08000 [Streptomyces finlayi]
MDSYEPHDLDEMTPTHSERTTRNCGTSSHPLIPTCAPATQVARAAVARL